ncbi:sorting nexin-6 [Esox lucius]|uniref:PX domain-containing protein n=1 Tax=Esox lucius TaxID=8010 RepID=A0A3P8YUG6_ESOLU|nr:sorting nexin-6 [Esox lucius]XP_010879574.2 sorting nexin-6 [Esox lucius]
MMEEDREGLLRVSAHTIRVTEAVRDGDSLTFIVISQKLSGSGEYHVARTHEDFEWLQQCLFSQEEVPGVLGVIFPPLPAKPHLNASTKVLKQLGFLVMGKEWCTYCKALEIYLQQVAANTRLNKNKCLENFLTSSDAPGQQRVRKSIFNRLSQAVEGLRKEGHKDVDDFFQTERDNNFTLTGCSKSATERFLDVVLTEQKLAVACGHLSTCLHLCVEQRDDGTAQAFSQICVKLSEVVDLMKKNFENVAENNLSTLGLGLDLETRYQEAKKEMLYRRTCKLVELETASKNAERAKPIRKAAMDDLKMKSEKEFDQISGVAKQEIARFHSVHVKLLHQALILWCEKQLETAKETSASYSQHLQAFKDLGE